MCAVRLASFAGLPFSVHCHAGKQEKYGEKLEEQRKKKRDATKKKEGLPR